MPRKPSNAGKTDFSARNVKLVEQYADLESLCNRSYGCQHGITAYIDEMKDLHSAGSRAVTGWAEILDRLTQVRHKRNQLSHGEIPFSQKCASEADIRFLTLFKELLENGRDPLSVLRSQKPYAKGASSISLPRLLAAIFVSLLTVAFAIWALIHL